MNTYGYANGNALAHFDPEGLFVWKAIDIGFGLYEVAGILFDDCTNTKDKLKAIGVSLAVAATVGVTGKLLYKAHKKRKAAKGAGSAANSANKVKLNKQLASQEQVGELNSGSAERFIGAGTSRKLEDAPRLANKYGGEAGDYAKIRSSNRKHLDGFSQETHAYQNVKTGQIVEHKTKISGH